MKKFTSFSAILLIAAFASMSSLGKAQGAFMAPQFGLGLDQDGPIRLKDFSYGIHGGTTVLQNKGSLGISFSNLWWRYQDNRKTMDMTKDSLIWRTSNAPTIQGIVTINIPGGSEEGEFNPFAGPVFGMGYGVSFLERKQANSFKIFLQGNYSGQVDKYRVGGFVQVSFDFLYASLPHNSSPLFSAVALVGLRFEIPNAFSGGSGSDY